MSTPAADIPTALRSDDWCDRWIAGGMAKATADFGLRPNSFSEPQDYEDGTTTLVWLRSGSYTFKAPIKLPGTIVPSTGSDHQFDLHCKDGTVISGWQLIGPNSGIGEAWNRTQAWAWNRFNGRNASMSDSFAATISIFPPGDETNLNVNDPAIPLWFVPKPEQVAAGAILNRLPLCVPRSVSMSGPLAPLSVTDCEDPDVGKKFGCSASPALYLESKYKSTPAQLSAMVPDGMSGCLELSNDDIAAWVKQRGFAGPLAITARIFAVCLRDYGWTQAETGGWTVFPCDGSPAAQKQWKAMGLTPTTDLFGGLFTRERMRALRPPTSTDAKGNTFTREGPAVSISY